MTYRPFLVMERDSHSTEMFTIPYKCLEYGLTDPNRVIVSDMRVVILLNGVSYLTGGMLRIILPYLPWRHR